MQDGAPAEISGDIATMMTGEPMAKQRQIEKPEDGKDQSVEKKKEEKIQRERRRKE